jgi:hypothetical protein
MLRAVANHTTAIYNASAVKIDNARAVEIYNATSSLGSAFWKKTHKISSTLKNAPAYYNAGAEVVFKFWSRRIVSWWFWVTLKKN